MTKQHPTPEDLDPKDEDARTYEAPKFSGEGTTSSPPADEVRVVTPIVLGERSFNVDKDFRPRRGDPRESSRDAHPTAR